MSLYVVAIHSFFRLYNYPTIYLLILLSIDNWVVFRFSATTNNAAMER